MKGLFETCNPAKIHLSETRKSDRSKIDEKLPPERSMAA